MSRTRTRLDRLEVLTARDQPPATPTQPAPLQAHAEAMAVWLEGHGPFPPSPSTEDHPAAFRCACLRVRGDLAPGEYLPDMTALEQEDADVLEPLLCPYDGVSKAEILADLRFCATALLALARGELGSFVPVSALDDGEE